MRSWWKTLGLLLGMTWGTAMVQTAAHAQFPPPGPGGFGMPPGPGMMGPPPGSGMFGPPPGMMGAGGPPGMGPGAFGPPAPGKGAEFPNAAPPSQEPVSPFSIKDEGMPNAFTELHDPRPRIRAPYVLAFRGEYIGWQLSNGPLTVPLVTTTNPTLASFGQLGNANTVVLLNSGPGAVDYKVTNGYRLTMMANIGVLPPIEITGFQIQNTSVLFSGGSLTNPNQFLAMPFQDVNPAFIIPGSGTVGTEAAAVIAIPNGSPVGSLGGTINITSAVSFWGAEANFFLPIIESDSMRVDAGIGYRHLQLEEKLNISTQSGGQVGGTIFNGNQFAAGRFTTTTFDGFSTTNAFDGGQLVMRATMPMGRWSFIADSKIALGETTQRLTVGGNSNLIQLVANRPVQSANGGIYALPSNSGTISARAFTYAPEANVALSFQLTHCVRVYGGYNYLYWSSVTRPGDALNSVLDSRQIPTSFFFAPGASNNGPSPPSLSHRSFVAQGIFVGVEIGF